MNKLPSTRNHHQIIDLTGQKFTRLEVLEFAYMKSHCAYWKCKCDCGNISIVNGVDLRRGDQDGKGTKSCGCLAIEKSGKVHTGNKYAAKEYMEASKNRIFDSYKASAKKRNISFELTFNEFILLTSQNCYYDGTPPSQSNKSGSYYGTYIYNGLDRIDSSRGYTLDNCVPCCKTCNFAKHSMNEQEFYAWINRILENGMPLMI